MALIEREDNPGAELDVAGIYRDRRVFREERRAGQASIDHTGVSDGAVEPCERDTRIITTIGSRAGDRDLQVRRQIRITRGFEKSKFILIRAPITFTELKQLCIASVSQQARGEPELSSAVPARRFTDKALLAIANASQSLACECPVHLVDLIRGLTAFETYSKECIVANPTDATVHSYLHAASAQARSIIEEALTHVAEADGLHPRA